MTPVHLAGTRLVLREVEPEDTAALLAIYGNPEATRHLSFEPRTRDQVQGIVDRSIASAKDTPRSEYRLAITPLGEHRLIGYARLATEPQRAATVGFALNPAEWGKGLGTETVHCCGRSASRSSACTGYGLHARHSTRHPRTPFCVRA
ncbi:GNAT family N-acetyltransferase [Streptomyces sp. NPDC060334]|uniref:GNAT family N-acetyltransferase n=1 Tax=unclassified Streptomyces TaxID=2593676 RepID=UPI003656AB9B